MSPAMAVDANSDGTACMMTFKAFTEEQWQAIRSVRDDWYDDIDWSEARQDIEGMGCAFFIMRAQRTQLGSPVKIRNSLRTLLQQTRTLQAGLNELPAPFRGSDAGLDALDRRLESYLLVYDYSGGEAFRGRRDPYRIWLEDGLLKYWTDRLDGDLSFSRTLDNKPHGPLIEFLTLTLQAITGSAPGPDRIAKIIDQYRKAPDLPL
jgi:hypothetical protein